MMRKTLLSLLGAGSLLLTMNAVWSDDGWGSARQRIDITPVQNALYQEECGSCHYAYPPGLLPAPSWHKVMGSLDDHFGENAELGTATARQLSEYLALHAADVSETRRSARILRSLGGETPLRITHVPYIRNMHKDIPTHLIRDNAQVRSLSNCAACHTRADRGYFAQKEVTVPGAGKWEWGFD